MTTRRRGEADAEGRQAALARLAKLERLFAYRLGGAVHYQDPGWRQPPNGPQMTSREDYWRSIVTGAASIARMREELGLPPGPPVEIPDDLQELL